MLLLGTACGREFGNGYRLVEGRGADDVRLMRADEVVVPGTIIDVDQAGNTIAGIRLPVDQLKCDGGYQLRIRYEKQYFLLSIDDGALTFYDSKGQFDQVIRRLGIRERVSLNYSQFDVVWKRYASYYERIDYSTCEVL